MIFLLLLFALYFPTLFSGLEPEEKAIKRIYAHLLLNDASAAEQEAKQALQQFPTSKPLWEASIKALSKKGDDQAMLEAWDKYIQQFPDEKNNHEMNETLAWGVLNKGALSTSPVIRIYTMLGAHFSNDAKGVEILKKQLRDHNAVIRAVAVQLSGKQLDDKLRDEVLRLFKEENNWIVRQEVLHAVGTMRLRSLKPDLVQLIESDRASAEEKAAAIQSLVNLFETADRNEVLRLSQCDRAGLRDVACQVVKFFLLTRDVDLIAPLINDHRPEVRASALGVMASLGVKEVLGYPIADWATPRLNDLDPDVGIMAARVLTLNDPMRTGEAFKCWIEHPTKEVRAKAAAALASCGTYGLTAMKRHFYESEDLYVRMNLAIGLIGLREDVGLACDALYEGLSHHEKWMWDENGEFKTLLPSKIKHDDLIPNYPEAVNQMTRLELLNTLAVMKYPKAQDAIKRFLGEKQWNLTGLASVVLLTEGDETAIDLVSHMLHDSDAKIRLQAALILSLWGQGEEALTVLQEAYSTADRDMKEKILESMGRIRSEKSTAFLVDKLKEPYQTLRIIAASALLMSLYQ